MTASEFIELVANISDELVVLANTLTGVSSGDTKTSTGDSCEAVLQVYEVCVPRLGLD